MTDLVVEDGTGKPDADSYGSRTAADTYHADRANTTWATTDPAVRDAKLRDATAWLDGEYGSSYPGTKATQAQALGWPRVGGVDPDGYPIAENAVPKQMQRATFEVAFAMLTTDPRVTPEPPMTREKLGSAYEVEWDTTMASTSRYPFVGPILAPLMPTPGGGGASFIDLARG